MTQTSIAACLGGDFLAQALHREHRHVPGALDVAGLMTWDDLNQILAAHRMEPPRMRLSRDGETLLVGGYTTPVATRRHTVWHRLHPAELHARLLEGASLALDSVDELHPPIARLCEAIERELRPRVQANLYASWSATEGFGTHWDDHDTVIVQLDGAKRWRIYGTTRPFPLYRDIEDPGEAPTEPVADLVLWPGDVLYVPRGVWHAVSADQGTRSLHVTCGLQTHTATDLMAWVSEQLLTHEDWRRDLPLLAAPDVQADAVNGMGKRLAELLDDPGLLARYRAAMDGQAVGRMVPSLPYIDTVPVDGGLRVRLTTARAVLDVGEDTVTLSAAGTVYEFAPEAEAVLRPLADGRTMDLATLADTAGLALEDVAALVQELVAGQAATVGSADYRRGRRRAAGLPSWRLVRYADDFVVLVDGTRQDTEALHEEIARVLAPMGLQLSPAKTQVVHLSKGFDFLGFHIQWRRKRGTNKWYVYTFIADRPVRSVKAKIRHLTHRTSQQDLAVVLINLNRVTHGWANYFRHAVAKHVFSRLDDLVWWRVIRLLRTRHHWSWSDVRRRLTTATGRWLPVSADGIELRKISAIPVTRYRYRGNQIPTPWGPATT